MLQHIKQNWVFYLFGVLGFLFAIYILVKVIRKSNRDSNNYYYMVVDEDGVESYVHDSGITIDENINNITLYLLPTEITNGQAHVRALGKPKYVKVSTNCDQVKDAPVQALNPLDITYSKENDMYTIKVLRNLSKCILQIYLNI